MPDDATALPNNDQPYPAYVGTRPDWALVRYDMRGELRRYVEHGIRPGVPLLSVLCNDLKGSVQAFGYEGRAVVFNLVSFLYNHAPAEAWGDPDLVSRWLASGGLEGQKPKQPKPETEDNDDGI